LITGHAGDDNKIRVWNPSYQLIKQFGKKGSEPGKFDAINGMAIDSSQLYILQRGTTRDYKLSVTVKLLY